MDQNSFNVTVIKALSQVLARQDVTLVLLAQAISGGNQERQDELLAEAERSYNDLAKVYASSFLTMH